MEIPPQLYDFIIKIVFNDYIFFIILLLDNIIPFNNFIYLGILTNTILNNTKI